MSIDVDIRDGVGRIVIDRPRKLNAMTDAMWSALLAALRQLDADPTVSVILLTGAGQSFCAGSDVGTLLSDEPLAHRMRVSNGCVLAIVTAATPVVARVRGVAAGAGVNLALACDLVVAATDARFSEIFVRRGLALDTGGSWLLPRLVSAARARELAFLGGEVGAAQALDWGLISRVAQPEDLDAKTEEIVRALAGANPAALAASKRLLRAGARSDLPTALEAEIAEQVDVVTGPWARDHIAAFTGRPTSHGRRSSP